MLSIKIDRTNQNRKLLESTNDWFYWLIDRDFVIQEDSYRLDDVARDVIRASQIREDEQNFRYINSQLAKYFEQLASSEVASNQPISDKYENSDWCRYIADSIYYCLFSNRDKGQTKILTHFFEGAYFAKPGITTYAIAAVSAEAEPKDNKLLPRDTQRFLDNVQSAILFGHHVIGNSPSKYEFNIEVSDANKGKEIISIKPSIESGLEHCFRKVDDLTGLAKYVGLMGKAQRSRLNQRLFLIRQAYEEAKNIATFNGSDFNSLLFAEIADGFHSMGCFEEALVVCEKGIELNPDDYGIWNDRGRLLFEMNQTEGALESFNEAVRLNSYENRTWLNRGELLMKLGKYQDALTNLNHAIEITEEEPEAWSLRGLCLSLMGQYEDAIRDMDKAFELNKNEPLYLANKGIILARAGSYSEALNMCDQALKLKEDESGYYCKACCYALQNREDLAIKSLQNAIKFDPKRCRQEAKYNPDFENLREHKEFQTSMQS